VDAYPLLSITLSTSANFALLILLPTLAQWTEGGVFPVLVMHALTWLFLVSACFVIPFPRSLRTRTTILLSIAALYYTLLTFLLGYQIYTGDQFSPFFFFDHISVIIPTGLGIFDVFGLSIIVGILIVTLCGSFLLMWWFLRVVREMPSQNVHSLSGVTFALSIVVLAILPNETHPFLHQFKKIQETTEARETITPFVPANDQYFIESTENVIILQLESLNAQLLENFSTSNGEHVLPILNRAMQRAVSIPFFHANSIQTNRAQASLLCGIVNNFNTPFSYRIKSIDLRCLPEILSEHNYQTIAYRSDELSFANTGDFFTGIGFQEVHQEDIMEEDDVEYDWGYDDCMFYKRVFAHLQEKHAEKQRVFAFVEVSTHHYPWESQEKYAFTHLYEKTPAEKERYINSARQQDHCLGVFMEEFERYAPENTHLFITSDTSQPMGLHGQNTALTRFAYEENFLIPFIYIPPKKRREEFIVGEEVRGTFSQADFVPTLFELLNNESEYQSFAYALRGERKSRKFEECALLAQPYHDGGVIIVVNGTDKFSYTVASLFASYTNLDEDPMEEQPPKVLSTNMDYEEFKERYFCERYR